MKRSNVKSFFQQFGNALRLLLRNDPLRLAGATAFFATFALPFILIILIQIFSFLFDQPTISRQLFYKLSDIVGVDSATQVGVIIGGFRRLVHEWWAVLGGSVFMLFVATTLFKVIKNSFNQLWMIHITSKKALPATMMGRLRSLLIILFTAFLFIAGVAAESMRVQFSVYITEFFPTHGALLNSATSIMLSVIMAMIWFAMLFRYISEGTPAWKVTFMSAFITSALFTFGKYLLKWLLIDSNISHIFGDAGAFVLLLLFIFYSSLIVYYGAAFTKVWGIFINEPMELSSYASLFKYQKVEETESKM